MSANTFDFKLREREQHFDAWWDTSPSLPSWLGTASGSTLGALPTGMTLTASGMQSGDGYYSINASGTEAVNASGRIAVSGLLTLRSKEITFELDGVVMSESRAGSDESAYNTQCDYLFFLNGAGSGVIFEHSASAGQTQLRIIENNVTRTVGVQGLDLLKYGNGARPKNFALKLKAEKPDSFVFSLLHAGGEIFSTPVAFVNTASNHSIRAAFGVTRISGSDPQYMRFEKVRLNVKR